MDECGLVAIGHWPHYSSLYGLDRRTKSICCAGVFQKQNLFNRDTKSFSVNVHYSSNNAVSRANTTRMRVKKNERGRHWTPEICSRLRQPFQDVLQSYCCVRNFDVTRILKSHLKLYLSLKLGASCGSKRMGLKRTKCKIF